MRHVVLLLVLAGCAAPQDTTENGRPRVADEARRWESQANMYLQRARAAQSIVRTERFFGSAIRDLRLARDLYQAELDQLERAEDFEHPAPAGRHEALILQVNRLSAQIEELYKDRPIEP